MHLIIQILVVGALSAAAYHVIFKKFGLSSRCRKDKSYTPFEDGTVICQVVPDANMAFSQIKAYVESKGCMIVTLGDLQTLAAKRKGEISWNSRIIGCENGKVYALDVDYDPHDSYSRSTRIIELVGVGSFEDCRIAIKEVVSVEEPVTERKQVAA